MVWVRGRVSFALLSFELEKKNFIGSYTDKEKKKIIKKLRHLRSSVYVRVLWEAYPLKYKEQLWIFLRVIYISVENFRVRCAV